MKKVIIMIGICASLFAQQTQVVSWNRMYKPKLGKRSAFIKEVANKTKKYNSKKGTQVIRTYEVINGPNVGSFVRGGIAGGWEQFDNPPSNQQAGRRLETPITSVQRFLESEICLKTGVFYMCFEVSGSQQEVCLLIRCFESGLVKIV